MRVLICRRNKNEKGSKLRNLKWRGRDRRSCGDKKSAKKRTAESRRLYRRRRYIRSISISYLADFQDDKKRPAAEPMRQAKKLPLSPKKQNREMETVKSVRPPVMALPSKVVKHALEPEDNKPRTANYTTAGKSIGQPQHGQDIKRRRTEDIDDKEIITSKPMRVSVVKQV
jgi:hypothetical protein